MFTSKLFPIALIAILLTACGSTNMPDDGITLGQQDSRYGHSMANQIVMIKDDKSFLEHMIPHHEEAVQSARQLLQLSENAMLKSIAEKIITAQTAEIEQMKTWYKTWFAQDYKAVHTYMPMMSDLSRVEKANVDRSFIEGMIQHHNAALLSANSLLSFTARPELINLANSIIDTQSKEIIELQSLLKK